MKTGKRKTHRCPGCCPDGGAIFDAISCANHDYSVISHLWKCRNCGYEMPRRFLMTQQRRKRRLAATLAAALVAAAPAWAQPSGAGGDYYGGGPLTHTPQAQAPLTRWWETPLPVYRQPESETQRRIRELQEQNQLLGQEWTQQILRDALRR